MYMASSGCLKIGQMKYVERADTYELFEMKLRLDGNQKIRYKTVEGTKLIRPLCEIVKIFELLENSNN